MNDTPTTIMADCAKCGGPRNCRVQGQYKERSLDEHFDWLRTWSILQCAGCDYTFIRTSYSSEEDQSYQHNFITGEDEMVHEENIDYWPALSKRQMPEWMAEYGVRDILVGDLDRPLSELYSALNAGLYILSGVGIRTVFDVASEVLGVDESLTFARKLDALVPHIGKINRSRLEIFVEAGNASAHRGWRPTADDLSTLMDILEGFIEEAFIAPERTRKLDERAAKVKAGVPARPLRKKPDAKL